MRALMTGANGDIGFAILSYLLDNNFEVVVLDKNVDKLNQLSQKKPFTLLNVDLLDKKHIENLLNDIDSPFNVIIYAAGVREISNLIDLTLSTWENVIDINLTGAFLISKFAATLAIKNNISLCIIYISSISGLFGEPERSAYCSSKHGLVGLAKCLAIELASHEIRVNTIAPGLIDSELTRCYQNNPETMHKLNSNIPLSRWGKPQHIVQAVDLIIKNDYLTGSTLVIDGGWTAGKKL